MTRFDDIESIAWFGDSWVYGSELELDNPGPLTDDEFRKQNRFTSLVSLNFRKKELNFGVPGISSEGIVNLIYENLSRLNDNRTLVIILWPTSTRYFWINGNRESINIRSNDWEHWYRNVDNFNYRSYVYQRSVWCCQNFLNVSEIPHFGISCADFCSFDYYPEIKKHWMNGTNYRLCDELGFNLDHGWPSYSEKHSLVWPCYNHPNSRGHVKISHVITEYINEIGK